MREAQEFLIEWGPLLGAGVVVVVIYMVGRWWLNHKKSVPGEEKMKKEEYLTSKRQRRNKERSLIADGVGDLLLNLFAAGAITEDRYKYWHLRFGTQLALKDLLPQKLTPEDIKSAMKKRVGNGVYKPVPFFKTTGEKKYKPKNKIDAILHRHFV